MTQPLRTLHRRVWLVLAIALPVAFVAGLLARKPQPFSNPGIHWNALEPR
jgi:hypothetical protein